MCYSESRISLKPFLFLMLLFTALSNALGVAVAASDESGQKAGASLTTRLSQSIVFDTFPRVVTGGSGTITATASSGLPVNFSTTSSKVCSVSGMTVSGIGPGLCKITASQPGNQSYARAPSLTYTFRVVAPVANLLTNPIYMDSTLQGDWNLHLWTDENAPVTTSTDATAPGFSGKTIEVLYGPGGNGYGAFGLADMTDWNHVTTLYMNEVKTLEFDI